MRRIRHILVGIDFSPQSSRALEEGIILSRKHSAKLTLLHGLENTIPQHWDAFPLNSEAMKEARLKHAQDHLDMHLSTFELDDLDCHREVIVGRPSETLLQICKDQQIDLVILGQTKTTWFERLLVGSTARRLVHLAPVPVMLVLANKPTKTQRIIVPIDFSSTSLAALQQAVLHAVNEKASIHILHAYERLPLEPFIGLLSEEEYNRFVDEFEEPIQEKFDTFLKSIDFQGVPYYTHLKEGFIHQEIARFAEDQECDLLVMGSIGRTGMQGLLLGNTAERIMHNPPCSMLIVKPEGP